MREKKRERKRVDEQARERERYKIVRGRERFKRENECILLTEAS